MLARACDRPTSAVERGELALVARTVDGSSSERSRDGLAGHHERDALPCPTDPHEHGQPADQGRGGAAGPARARSDRADARRRRTRGAASDRGRCDRGRKRSCASRSSPVRMRGSALDRLASRWDHDPVGQRDRLRQARLWRSRRGHRRRRPHPIARPRPTSPCPPTRWSSSSKASRSPGNVGAVLRSADGAGADAARRGRRPDRPVQPERHPGQRRDELQRPDRGCLVHGRDARWLGERGLRIVAARVDADRLYTDADLTGSARHRARRRSGRPLRGLDGPRVSKPSGCRCSASPTASTSRSPPRSCSTRRGASAASRVARRRRCNVAPMDAFDFVIIGAGPAGEAAAYKARELGASVAVIDRLWFGGQLPPHRLPAVEVAARRRRAARRATRTRTTGTAASAQRDYMVNRPADAEEPDDWGHVRALEKRRRGRLPRHRRRSSIAAGSPSATTARRTSSQARNVVVAVGSTSKQAADRGSRRASRSGPTARRP